MSIVNSIRSQLAPIHPQGYPFVGGFALASLVLFWIWTPLGWIGTIADRLVRLFLPRSGARDAAARRPRGRAGRRPRQPCRQCRAAAGARLGDRPLPRISIFMSVFDCHVNRSPVAGRIERIVYRAGKFLNADLDKASEDNERNCFIIASPRARIGVVQIAGLIARRIVPFVQEGQTVARRRPHRHDPVRFPGRRLSAGRRAAAGRRGPDRARRRDRDCRPHSAPTAPATYRIG